MSRTFEDLPIPALAAAKHWDGMPSLWSVAILIKPWIGPPTSTEPLSSLCCTTWITCNITLCRHIQPYFYCHQLKEIPLSSCVNIANHGKAGSLPRQGKKRASMLTATWGMFALYHADRPKDLPRCWYPHNTLTLPVQEPVCRWHVKQPDTIRYQSIP